MWLLRARMILRWSLVIFPAVRANNTFRPRPLSHQDWTIALVARWTWHTVHSGFFPPQRLLSLHQKQVTHGAENQVPFQAKVTTPFI